MIYAQISPNKHISVKEEKEVGLTVSYKGVHLFNINAHIEGKATKVKGVQKVDYDMKVGKKLHCTNEASEMRYTLSDGKTLVVHAYNDGVTWRTLGGQMDSIGVNMSMAKNSWLQKWTEPYEEFYNKNVEETAGSRWAYPSLFEFPNHVYVLLSESDVNKYNSVTSLYSTGQKGVFDIVADRNEVESEQSTLSVAIVGTLGEVVSSTLVTDAAAPCKIDDTSWIEPGVASWVYWAYNHGSNDYNIIKKYTDMAAELHLPYVLIDAEWDEMKDGKTVEDAINYAKGKGVKPMIWYNSSVGWVDGAPGPKFKLNKPEDREKEFAKIEAMGVAGVKIDFFSGDTQMNMEYMIDLLESAARHHLLVNFHGATLPRGWQRTYPNLISTEAVYGAEWYNNVPTFTEKAAAHNATLPFTRNVIGSMDYTPCAFTDSQHPHITSHAHELALTALFESGIQHLADRPESFLAQPKEVKEYLSNLPTAWDETRLLEGEPGKYVVMARRKGSTWYIAGINGTDKEMDIRVRWSNILGSAVQNSDSKVAGDEMKWNTLISQKIRAAAQRKEKVPVDWLALDGQKVTIQFIEDSGKGKENPWNIYTVTNGSTVPTFMHCQPRGGFIITLKH